jgi:hypothetical protein
MHRIARLGVAALKVKQIAGFQAHPGAAQAHARRSERAPSGGASKI